MPTSSALRRALMAAYSWGGGDDDDAPTRRDQTLRLLNAELARISGGMSLTQAEPTPEQYQALLEMLSAQGHGDDDSSLLEPGDDTLLQGHFEALASDQSE